MYEFTRSQVLKTTTIQLWLSYTWIGLKIISAFNLGYENNLLILFFILRVNRILIKYSGKYNRV